MREFVRINLLKLKVRLAQFQKIATSDSSSKLSANCTTPALCI